ncbi:MAG: hydrogenase maturation protease [Roseiarcus sp.]|jgi:hydrogenase maturation protease
MTGNALIVGYGNPLRGDDGVGQAVARAFAGKDALDGVEAIACHQLTPELAERFAAAARVVLIDAAAGSEAGRVSVMPLQPAPAPASTLGHHVEPAQLLHMAQALYGRSPEAYLVTVGVGSLELGEGLSPPVMAALPEVIATVRRLALMRPADA